METLRALPVEPGILPESARWVVADDCFQWVDIVAGKLWRWWPSTDAIESRDVPAPAAALLPGRGTQFLADATGVSRYDWATGASSDRIELPLAPNTRLNDGGADPSGRLWIGSLSTVGAEKSGELYRIAEGGEVTVELTGVSVSNGIGWSPDGGRAYYVDSGSERIDVLEFDADGRIASRRRFADVELPGVADGLTVDADGGVWVAIWDGGCVFRFAPDGMLDVTLELPAIRPTSVAFGGPDLSTLLVTTATFGLDDRVLTQSPGSGLVYVVETDRRGLPVPLVAI